MRAPVRAIIRVFLAPLLASLVPPSACMQVTQTVAAPCHGWDLNSTNMYTLAFEWTHHNTVLDWAYVADADYDRSPRKCVHVSYVTQINLQNMFRHLVPSKILKTRMAKDVCAQGDVLTETVNLSDVVVIKTLQIRMRARIDANKNEVRFMSAVDLDVPWYLEVLQDEILHQIRDSMRDYHTLIAQTLCKKSN